MTTHLRVPGLRYIPCYLSLSEQSELLNIIDAQPWLTDLKRRVQHYGWRYDYKSRRVSAEMYLGALPEWAAALSSRMHRDGLISQPPDQLIINEYQPGQGIAPHVDCIPCFGSTILSASLGSPCVMSFMSISTKHEVPILLEPGSLIVMRGEARNRWKHGIAARKTDIYQGKTIKRGRRVSLTFRTVKQTVP